MSKDSIFTSPNNQKIAEYLEFYFQQSSPGYAVLLTGEWGSGKTWFIEQLLLQLDEDQNHVKFSIAGCQTSEDLNNRLLLAYMSVDSKFAKKAEQVIDANVPKPIKSALQFFAGFGKDRLKKRAIDSKIIIVIDDLERSDVPTAELVGFINEFVEQTECAVVLVANAEKLEKNKQSSFSEVKEKIIGQTFTVHAEIDSAVRSFYTNTGLEKPSIEKAIEAVKNVFSIAPDNLRSIRQSFNDYNRIYQSSPTLQTVDDENCLWVFLEVLVYRVGLNTSYITQQDICNCIDLFNEKTTLAMKINSTRTVDQQLCTELQEKSYEKIEKYTNKIFQGLERPFYISPIFRVELVYDFFCRGLLDEVLIEERINNSLIDNNTSPEWAFLWDWGFRDDEEIFQSDYKMLWDNLVNVKPMHPGDLLHIIGIFLELKEYGYGSITSQKLLEAAQNYIQKNTWSIDELEYVQSFQGVSGWRNCGYKKTDHPVIKKIRQQLAVLLDETRKANIVGMVHELPNRIRENPEKALAGYFYMKGSDAKNLYDKPVLVDLNVEEFVQALLSTTANTQFVLCSELAGRYDSGVQWLEDLIDERPIFHAIIEKIKKHGQSDNCGDLARLRIKYLVETVLEGGLKNLMKTEILLMKEELDSFINTNPDKESSGNG